MQYEFIYNAYNSIHCETNGLIEKTTQGLRGFFTS